MHLWIYLTMHLWLHFLLSPEISQICHFAQVGPCTEQNWKLSSLNPSVTSVLPSLYQALSTEVFELVWASGWCKAKAHWESQGEHFCHAANVDQWDWLAEAFCKHVWTLRNATVHKTKQPLALMKFSSHQCNCIACMHAIKGIGFSKTPAPISNPECSIYMPLGLCIFFFWAIKTALKNGKIFWYLWLCRMSELKQMLCLPLIMP